jgi:prepilin-type N-terminal cleavage/methylation domain-containing protein
MCPMGRQVNRKRGLTLVEMVLALVVLGMVTASITAIFGAASDLVEKGRTRTELVQAGRAAMNRLLAELRSATAIEARSDNYLRVYCSGTTDTGSFSRRIEFWADGGTLWRRVEGETEQALAENVVKLDTGGLTFWSKLDSVADVLVPQLGPAGSFEYAPSWRSVKWSYGFWSPGGSSARLIFPTSGVLNGECGTIEFWMRPSFSALWPGLDRDKYLVDTESGGVTIQFFFDKSSRKLKLRVNGLGVEWAPTWAPDEITHVALVWDCTGKRIGGGRTVALYVDGELCESTACTSTWSAAAFGPHFCFGKATGGEAEAAFDNLRIYDYCKTDLRDRYREQAVGLVRVTLTLEDPDAPGETVTISGGAWAQ